MANNRKRILDRFRKTEERRQQIYDLVAGAFGFKRIKVHPPKSDDLVFGYFQSSCEVLAVDNAWGFEIHKNGQMIFRHDRRPPDWKFKKELYHLPKEAPQQRAKRQVIHSFDEKHNILGRTLPCHHI